MNCWVAKRSLHHVSKSGGGGGGNFPGIPPIPLYETLAVAQVVQKQCQQADVGLTG